MKKLLFTLLFCATSLFGVAGCNSNSETPKTKAQIILDYETVSLEKYDDFLLTYSLIGVEGIPTWKSNKTSVATIDANGLIKGVGVGTCEITASIGKISTTCSVAVTPTTTSALLHCEYDDVTLGIGDIFTFSFYVTYKGEVVNDAVFNVGFFYDHPSNVANVIYGSNEVNIQGMVEGTTVATIYGTVRDTEFVKDISITVSNID